MSEQGLFGDMADRPADSTPAEGPFAAVAIERSLDHVLDYRIPKKMAEEIQLGQRVKVPLGRGNKPAWGYVVEIRDRPRTDKAIKAILGADDRRVLLPGKLLELSRWIGKYYCCPLGAVIDSVIPSAVKKKIGMGYVPMVRVVWPGEKVAELLEKTRAPKRRAVLGRLMLMEPGSKATLLEVASDAGVKMATVRNLAKVGVISVVDEPEEESQTRRHEGTKGNSGLDDNSALSTQHSTLVLNEDQQRVMDELGPRVRAGEFSVNLLFGVTGSGKTEIYLRCIGEAVAAGKRAIVLVPEIALTPQTVERFTARFGRVAVMHSGLAAGARHRFWRQIAAGEADVVVGARSAIFAPLTDVGVIVVDEEHEGSYKQDTAPRYHARDVAIKRGQLEGACVILGSATPSLEMWNKVSSPLPTVSGAGQSAALPRTMDHGPRTKPNDIYRLLTLPRRVRGLALPAIELIDMGQERRIGKRPGIHLLSFRLEHLLRTTLDAGKQAILLLNRRGYANFIVCPSCQHLVQCKYCDVTMTYHRSAGTHAHGSTFEEGRQTGQLHCHYCMAVNPLPEKCPECGKRLTLFGLGTQRVEEEITKKFPGLQFARVDSDTMHNARDYEKLLKRFGAGEIQVLLGTQMIAKGLDFPNVTLVGVISGDTALALPDFRAAERTFQLITQVAGRAGRGDSAGRVALQTFLPDDPTIRSALSQDFPGFASGELKTRAEVGLPPITRMVRIILRDRNLEKLHAHCEKLAPLVQRAVGEETARAGNAKAESPGQSGSPVASVPATVHNSRIVVKGPMPCAINRIAGYHRAQVLLLGPDALSLQRILAAVRFRGGFAQGDRIAVDVDPVALL